MTRDNPKVKGYGQYILYAIFGGVFFYFFLDISFKLAVVVINLAIKYYWASIIIVLVILFFKRKRGKK